MEQFKKIKVCGMSYAANIAEVADLKPDYMGFIFYENSPRNISEVSTELIKYIPKEIKTVGVFVDEKLEIVKRRVIDLALSAVQLHGQESPAFCATLKNEFPSLEVIKAFGVDENFDFSVLESYIKAVDFFLFDTKSISHGGSGKKFDWGVLKNYKFNTPYFLSGGIDIGHSANLKEIHDDRVIAIDVNSRFEIEAGLKDVAKLKVFFSLMQTV